MAVVTLGAHILDVLARPVESIPSGQDTVVVDEIRVTAAGAAAGTAVALARLGNDVVSVGAIGDDDPDKAARALLAQGPRTVVVTLGGEGSLVATAYGVERLPVLPVDVVDTTGCGDAYCAGFITGLTRGLGVLEAARWGTAAAATVAQGLGSDACLTDLGRVLALLE